MLRTAALCCLCVMAGAIPARAEWHVTPMIGLTFAGKTTFVDPDAGSGQVHTAVGIAGTWLSKGIVGAEAIATLTPGFFQTDNGKFITHSRATALMGNVVIAAPRKLTEYFLRPFVSGGFGLMRVSANDEAALATSVFEFDANLAGFNIGGGAIGFLSQGVGVRFDLRYYSTLHTTDRPPLQAFGDKANLRYMVASVGLVLRR
jgi:hypothetical protein